MKVKSKVRRNVNRCCCGGNNEDRLEGLDRRRNKNIDKSFPIDYINNRNNLDGGIIEYEFYSPKDFYYRAS